MITASLRDSDEMKKFLNDPPYQDGTPCRTEFINGMPNGTGVVIEKAGAEWTYDDGTKSTDALPNAFIGPGQSSFLASLTKCTVLTKCIIFVRVPGEPNLVVLEGSRKADPNACQVLVRFGVKPKTSVLKKDFGKQLPFELEVL